METKYLFVVSSEQTTEAACAITQMASCGNYTVTLKCDSQAGCQKATQTIKSSLDAKASKGEIKAEQVQTAMGHIRTTTDLGEAKNAAIVIETVFEARALKEATLRELDKVCPPSTTIITNSSTLTIAGLSSITTRPERVIGMHFIYFSPILKVVEIARGVRTSDAAFNTANGLAKSLDLEAVAVEDAPGLLSTRIWMIHLNEAANNVFNKLVDPAALKKLNRTISPNAYSILESADFIGLDNCIVLLQNLYQAYGDPKYAPSPLLTRMVDAGQLGVKTGRGFFNYT